MGIEHFIAQACTQTAVYWAFEDDDGRGGKTFTAPTEISCRWENKTELLSRLGDRFSEEMISSAQVFVTQDVIEGGYLYLGDEDDLDSDHDDPMGVDGAYPIKKFEKMPAMRSTTEFVRKAYL